MQLPEVKSFAALGFVLADEKLATHKMVKCEVPQYPATAWIVHPVRSSSKPAEAWTSCNGTVWIQRPWAVDSTGWPLQFTHDNGRPVNFREGQVLMHQMSLYALPIASFAKLSMEAVTSVPVALLTLNPSVNPHIVEGLREVSKKVARLGDDTSVTLSAATTPASVSRAQRAELTPSSVGPTSELRFTSATRLVVHTDDPSTAKDIADFFQAPHLNGFKELDLSRHHDGCRVATQVVLLKPPFLRSVIVPCPPAADALAPLCDAVEASPYVEALRINANRSNELLEALMPYAYRPKDANTATTLSWLDGPVKYGLHRDVPLESVAACLAKKEQLPGPQQPDDTLVIELLGTRSPPLLRSRLRFSAFLTELVEQERDTVLELPSRWRNEEGEEELENRFTDVDVRLAVLWLNDYACDAVHEMVKEDPTVYFVSLKGRTFFEQHIHKVDQPRSTLRRCLSVLALAHYLRIDTLESLMLSILASRSCQAIFEALTK